MTERWKAPNRRQFIWPAAGVLLGVLGAINPWYQPPVTVEFGIGVWFVDMVLALVLSVNPLAARLGTLVIGLSLAVPCFVPGMPLSRGLLMCCMTFPLLVIALPLLGPPKASYRERISYLFTWLGTRAVTRRAWSFDLKALVHFLLATIVLGAAMAAVKATPATSWWLLARWLAGGIMIFALAEMVTAGHDFLTALMGLSAPALMRSPTLSTSISEFWTKRWNPATSALVFRTFFFTPLARRGATVALWAAFVASAVAHVLLPYMAMGKLGISLMCGAFFLVQPLLIAAERAMNVRRWPTAAARVWALSALAITSPLFVEPLLQLLEPSWGAAEGMVMPTLVIVAVVIGVNAFCSLGSLATTMNPVQR